MVSGLNIGRKEESGNIIANDFSLMLLLTKMWGSAFLKLNCSFSLVSRTAHCGFFLTIFLFFPAKIGFDYLP